MTRMSNAANEIRKLQMLRSRPERDLSISGMIESFQTQTSQTQRKLGDLIELWNELVPANLVASTKLLGLRGGVLTVAADSSAVSFELDRSLREGLLAELRGRYRGTLTRVKVQVGSPPQP